MKDRTIVCKYYEYHGQCAKGKDAEVNGFCQHCALYEKKKNTKPFKVDKRKQKEKNFFKHLDF